MFNLPLRFDNPLFGGVGIALATFFAVLFYLSYKRLRTAEKSLELVKWRRVRKVVNGANIGAKAGLITALSLLLATPYLSVNTEVPIDRLSVEQMDQSAVTIMLLLDVSNSMNSSDLAPSRLQVSKQMSRMLVDNASPSDLVGFLSFAGNIYDEILPGGNRSAVLDLIDRQTFHQSTAIGTALETALGMLEPYNVGKAIVLFTDGKSNYGVTNLTEIANEAAELKIPIFTVFAGTYGIGEGDPVVLQEMSSVSGGKFHEIESGDMKALATEVGALSKEVKMGALKSAFETLTFEVKDYYTPLIFLVVLIAAFLFITWFTGV